MPKKQSMRALLLSTIRKERMVLNELWDHAICLMNIIRECEQILRSGVLPIHRKNLIEVDKDRLKRTIELRKMQEKLQKSQARLQNLEQQLDSVKADEVIEQVATEGLVVEPGWRWIRGLEHRYVWSTDGRVGTLKKNLLGDNWTLRLLKPLRRGFFKLSIGNGVTVRKSFSMIATESAGNPLILTFSDEGLFTAVTVGGQKVVIRLPKGK